MTHTPMLMTERYDTPPYVNNRQHRQVCHIISVINIGRCVISYVNVDCGPGQGLTEYLGNVDCGPGQCWLCTWSRLTVYLVYNPLLQRVINVRSQRWPGPESTLTSSTVNLDKVHSQCWPDPQSTQCWLWTWSMLTVYLVKVDCVPDQCWLWTW
jgi:hypothetical protein